MLNWLPNHGTRPTKAPSPPIQNPEPIEEKKVTYSKTTILASELGNVSRGPPHTVKQSRAMTSQLRLSIHL